jgi:hypothetical protein
MAGVQAQLPSAAQLSLWSRVRDLKIVDVENALDQRTLVKASCMRRTLFLVPSRRLTTFVRGSAQRAEKEINWARRKGVPDRILDAAIAATLNVLNQPLTRYEIAERVSRALGVQMQNIQGGGWGSRRKVAAVSVGKLTYPVVDLLNLVAARGVVCYGPKHENQPTFVRADAWIPNWQDLTVELAEDTLLHVYLRTYGPATPADFAYWTGITLTGARKIWSRNQTSLATVSVEGWPGTVLQKDLDELTRTEFERLPTRLLPYFDSFLLGHKERNHLVAANYRPKVYRPQGWIAPTVLVNGRVAGVWKHTQEGNRLRVNVTKFGFMPRHVAPSIREEARDLGRFLGIPKVDVQISDA